MRHRRARWESISDYACDARRLGHGRVFPAFPETIFRCGDCRAACCHPISRFCLWRLQACSGNLLDLPATRLRSAYSWCSAATITSIVRYRSRRYCRCRWSNSPRCIRFKLYALHPQHGDHGAVGRKWMSSNALHWLLLWCRPKCSALSKGLCHGSDASRSDDGITDW